VASPNREDFATFKAFLEANNNSFTYPARIQQQRAARTYVLMFERDGSFRAEDVPPGTYELRIQLTKPGQDRQAMFRSRPEDELGALVKEVLVPPGKDALDLGELVVPLRAGAPATREPALDLEARSLDGRLLSLAKYRGQPVLLVFWATWSDRSREQMAQLQKIQADPANSRLKLISVCIDGDAAAVKEIATGRAYRGEQAFLDKAKRGPAIEKLRLETLPAVFLLDEKGRVVGRDFEGERLQASLRRMTKAK
jgi:thiol-disulfide isomerase/thioredoxin